MNCHAVQAKTMSIERRGTRGNVRLLLAVLTLCYATGGPARVEAQAEPQNDAALIVMEIKPNFYMIAGAGSNVAVHIGTDSVVVTDTGRADMAGPLLAAIKRLTQRPIRYIINTSADPDHVGGNSALTHTGVPSSRQATIREYIIRHG